MSYQEPASEPQCQFLADLFVDCGFTITERRAFLEKRFGRQIQMLDQLTRHEAHYAITELKTLKERRSTASADPRAEEETV